MFSVLSTNICIGFFLLYIHDAYLLEFSRISQTLGRDRACLSTVHLSLSHLSLQFLLAMRVHVPQARTVSISANA